MGKLYRDVHVAYWAGRANYCVNTPIEKDAGLHAAEIVVSEVGRGCWQEGFTMPVAIYSVAYEDIDEITLDGPQLMVRGQPVACKRLTIVKP